LTCESGAGILRQSSCCSESNFSKGNRPLINRRNFLVGAAAATVAANSVRTATAATEKKLKVGIIGCGRMGQDFAEVYRRFPDTELMAIAEWNDERRPIVGERFGVEALYKDVNAMLKDGVVPDIVAVITPTKYMKEAVIRCAEAGVKGISTDKPVAARLSDADAMVDACRSNGVIFAGGNLQRAKSEVQQAAGRLRSGEYGKIVGVAMHGFGGEISGGGCQLLSVLRLLTNAEVDEVVAWADPAAALLRDDDTGLNINGRFRMSSGIDCQVFGLNHPTDADRNLYGVDVWTTNDTLVSWHWGVPKIFRGVDADGAWKEIDPNYSPFPYPDVLVPPLMEHDDYLVSSIRSFVKSVKEQDEDLLSISGHDLRQALEIAIASKQSALQGNRPVSLPLVDRSLSLLPSPYRWLGGDQTGNVQTIEDAAG